MATTTTQQVKVPDVDILSSLYYDRVGLRFTGQFTPCRYLYESDGTTHVLNDAGEWAVETTNVSPYGFSTKLSTVFEMQRNALIRMCTWYEARRGIVGTTDEIEAAVDAMLAAGEHIDNAQTLEWETLQGQAVTIWSQMVADYKASPDTVVYPSVENLVNAIGCDVIYQDPITGPFMFSE